MKRMERIENLDLVAFREQGIVGADVFIRISIVCCPLEGSPPIMIAGSALRNGSFCPSRCSVVSSAASSLPGSGQRSTTDHSVFTTACCIWLISTASQHGCELSTATTGSFTPSVLSEAPNTSCAISVPIPIVSQSPTTDSLH